LFLEKLLPMNEGGEHRRRLSGGEDGAEWLKENGERLGARRYYVLLKSVFAIGSR
jgi:hypothetical protein